MRHGFAGQVLYWSPIFRRVILRKSIKRKTDTVIGTRVERCGRSAGCKRSRSLVERDFIFTPARRFLSRIPMLATFRLWGGRFLLRTLELGARYPGIRNVALWVGTINQQSGTGGVGTHPRAADDECQQPAAAGRAPRLITRRFHDRARFPCYLPASPSGQTYQANPGLVVAFVGAEFIARCAAQLLRTTAVTTAA